MMLLAQEKPSSAKSVETNECGIEILSVVENDAGPYLRSVLEKIRKNWYAAIPEVARPPKLKRGVAVISFKIANDGSVSEMKLDRPSGDISLDRAAWAGIAFSNKFDRFPKNMTEKFIALRFKFCYNPQAQKEAAAK
jgi:TonB family protein